MIFDVAHVQVLPAGEPGVEDVHQIGQDLNDRLAAGQGLVAEVVDVAALGVGVHNGVGKFGQDFFEADVGGHDDLLGSAGQWPSTRIGGASNGKLVGDSR